MKKYLLLVLACAFAVLAAGCGSGQSSGAVNNGGRVAQPVTITETCDICGGAGVTVCTWCNGTGMMSAAGTTYVCSCGGSGYVTCYACGGAGERTYVQGGGDYYDGGAVIPGDFSITAPDMNYTSDCPSCGGLGWSVCSSCHGTGYLERTHSAPDYGFGSSTYTTQERCARCSGTGKAPCIMCGGDGQI